MNPSASTGKPKDLGIDLSQFADVFFEEASEHLASMESLLLEVSERAPSDEDLNAIFRAAHSIKGGAAMFGFQDVTELTHDLESVLDDVRKHTLDLTPEMIETFLLARDLTAKQLAGHRAGSTAPEDQAESDALRKRMRGFKAGALAAPAEKKGTAAAAAPAAVPAAATTDAADAEAEASYGRVTDYLVTGKKGATDADVRALSERAARQLRKGIAAAGRDSAPDAASTAAPASPAPRVMDSPTGEYGFFEEIKPAPAAAAAPAQAPAAADAAGAAEKAPAAAKAAGAAVSESNSIRVAVEKVDQLINMVGELVITQAMLQQRASDLDPVAFRGFVTAMSDLERNTRSLQQAVMSIRMLPMSMVFNRFPRMVRDLAAKLGKKVELKTAGEATELDKGLIEKIIDPLTHLVRNALDHGIETPERRLAAGKPATGTLTLSAYQQGGAIVIEVQDDGGGLNRERILAKARERGMPVSDSMGDQEVWQIIFEAGFSTAATVTDVSGRGVGMDVVKKNIGALHGTVEINSALGRGTRMTVRLPLTLAIMDGMSIAVGKETYIIPLASIVESLQVNNATIRQISNAGRVIQVRSEYLPVVSLREVFNIDTENKGSSDLMMVIVESEGAKLALVVDELLGQNQVVVKSIEANYKRVQGVSAATIMGDGRVAFILDVPAMIRMTRH
jgi:two-component system chemotaxis sensor kinase CheA